MWRQVKGWDGDGGQWLLCPGCAGCTNKASQNHAGTQIPLLLAKKPPTPAGYARALFQQQFSKAFLFQKHKT